MRPSARRDPGRGRRPGAKRSSDPASSSRVPRPRSRTARSGRSRWPSSGTRRKATAAPTLAWLQTRTQAARCPLDCACSSSSSVVPPRPPPQAIPASVWFLSPLLSSQLISTLSPAFAPLTRNENTGLREIAWLIWPSITVLPFSFTVTSWMKCTGITLQVRSFRSPVSIGWPISTRTSATSPLSVALIFIGSAISASASADGDFDFLHRGEVLAPGLRQHAHVGRFAHLHVDFHERHRAFHEIELRCERERVLFDQHRNRLRVRQVAADFDRHHRAVLRDLRRLDDDVLAVGDARGAEALERVLRRLGSERVLVPACGEQLLGPQQSCGERHCERSRGASALEQPSSILDHVHLLGRGCYCLRGFPQSPAK